MSPKNPLSDEDKAAFRAAVDGLSPWDDGKEGSDSQDSLSPAKRSDWVSLDYLPEPDWVGGETVLNFCRIGVTHKQFKRLATGQTSYEQKLDFHGHTTEQLHDALDGALHQAQLAGHRVLLLIHGKGRPDSRRPAILKNYINQSLRQNADVLAFHSAKAVHGGAGAVYVLLRGSHV